jgi:hypothetical protein
LQNKFSSFSWSYSGNERINIFHCRWKIELSYKSCPINKTKLNCGLRKWRINFWGWLGRSWLGGSRRRSNSWRRRNNWFSRNSTTNR